MGRVQLRSGHDVVYFTSVADAAKYKIALLEEQRSRGVHDGSIMLGDPKGTGAGAEVCDKPIGVVADAILQLALEAQVKVSLAAPHAGVNTLADAMRVMRDFKVLPDGQDMRRLNECATLLRHPAIIFNGCLRANKSLLQQRRADQPIQSPHLVIG